MKIGSDGANRKFGIPVTSPLTGRRYSKRSKQLHPLRVPAHDGFAFDAQIGERGGAGALCQLGGKKRGLEWADRALMMDSDDPSVLCNVACVYSLLGELDKAIDCLEKSIASGMGQKEWIEHDSDLDALRSHPRFQALLERL